MVLLHAIRCSASILLLLCASVTGIFAQAPAVKPRPAITVSGTVRDADGAAIANASVFFEEKATGASVEAKTKPDGAFSFLALRPGTYVVRVQASGFREEVTEPMELSPGEKKQRDFVLKVVNLGGVIVQASPPAERRASKPHDVELSDKPSFTVAGVTDWSNLGGHGSDTKLRASENLAKETATLKSSESGEISAKASEESRAADSHRELGDRAERLGDSLTAVHEYEEAVRLNPSEQNYFAWGAELLLHRAIKPAAEVFEKGSNAHPNSARMLSGLGAALYASGDYADGARHVCAASDLQPADPTPYIFLGKMEKAAPDPLVCAADKLARFAHNQPTDASANYYYAVALWKRAQRNEDSQTMRECELLLQKAVEADPNFEATYVELGTVQSARGSFARAIENYKKAIELNPRASEAHYRLAQVYKRVGEKKKAEEETQRYKQAEKTETAAIEQQRREIRQFLILLKDQP